MSILKVARMGNPCLQKISERVSDDWWKTADARQFIPDLIETMREYNGVGLAAPQVHRPIRVAVVEIGSNPRYPSVPPHPLTVLINPGILSDPCESNQDWEGCLSVPEIRGRVPRPSRVRIKAMDESGIVREISAEGFFARAIQHEIDHLDGKVFLERADPSTLAYTEEFVRYHAS